MNTKNIEIKAELKISEYNSHILMECWEKCKKDDYGAIPIQDYHTAQWFYFRNTQTDIKELEEHFKQQGKFAPEMAAFQSLKDELKYAYESEEIDLFVTVKINGLHIFTEHVITSNYHYDFDGSLKIVEENLIEEYCDFGEYAQKAYDIVRDMWQAISDPLNIDVYVEDGIVKKVEVDQNMEYSAKIHETYSDEEQDG